MSRSLLRAAARFAALGAVLAIVPSIAAAGRVPAPSAALLLYGNESSARPDGGAALLFNPAAAGMRYPSELAVSMLDGRDEENVYRAALMHQSFGVNATTLSHRTTVLGIGAAHGDARTRFGAATTWIPRDAGGRATDIRFGMLTRPSPKVAFGAVADHANRPKLFGVRLEREYTLGLALSTAGVLRSKSRRGVSLAVTGDMRFRHGFNDADYRVGAEIEPVPGIAVRGIYFVESRGFQIGLSLLAPRSGYHGQSGYDGGGIPRYTTHSLSFHEAEDQTTLVVPGARR